jgi:ATP-dependent protease ClpP protease subunit
MTIRPAPFARSRAERRQWYHLGPVLALAKADADDGEGSMSSATSADVYLYDVIGGWFGMTADDFVRDVASLDVDQLVLHLNSPGGDAAEGVTIANVLRAHRARVVVRVDGLAASAASVIAMAGDEIVMGIGSQMMIHDAWGFAVGNAAEMAAAQRMLDSTSDALAATFAARTGGSTAEWRDVMRAETWYTAEEAVAAGLADRVAAADETGTAEGEQITPGGSGGFWDLWDSLRSPDRFDLSAFNYAGRSQAPAPAMPGRQTPAASAAGRSNTEGDGIVPFLDDVRQRLGVAADADEATVMAALDEALEERTEAPETPVASLPPGVVTVAQSMLDELRATAQRGAQAHARQEREDRVRLVEAAIGDGRIPRADREHWLGALENSPSAGEVLAGLAKGLIPVDGERGVADDPEQGSFNQAEYDALARQLGISKGA